MVCHFAAKVDEHAEADREQLLLSSMDQPRGKPGKEQQLEMKMDEESKERVPLSSLQNILGFVSAVKDRVLGPLCKLLGH